MTIEEKTLNGYEVAKKLYNLHKERMKRLKRIVRICKTELEEINISQTELDKRADKLIKSSQLLPDFVEAQYMAIIDIISERK